MSQYNLLNFTDFLLDSLKGCVVIKGTHLDPLFMHAFGAQKSTIKKSSQNDILKEQKYFLVSYFRLKKS